MQLNDSLQKFSSAELLEAYMGRAKESQALVHQFPTKHRNLMQFYLLPALPNHDRDFYRRDHSIFQYQTMCKSSVELALFIKHSSLKWREQTNTQNSVASLEKQTASTVHITLGSLESWTKLSFPHNQKHTFSETFFSSKSCAALLLTLMYLLLGKLPIQGILPFMTSWRAMIEKKLSLNLYEPSGSVFCTETLYHMSKMFFFFFFDHV